MGQPRILATTSHAYPRSAHTTLQHFYGVLHYTQDRTADRDLERRQKREAGNDVSRVRFDPQLLHHMALEAAVSVGFCAGIQAHGARCIPHIAQPIQDVVTYWSPVDRPSLASSAGRYCSSTS